MNEEQPGAGPNRPPRLIEGALHAADALVNEVQQRMPPELVKQLRAGQQQIDQRLAQLQTQLSRSATGAEVERLSRRIDELSARLEELARSTSSRPPRSPRTGGAPPRAQRSSDRRTERPPRRETSERPPRREYSERPPRPRASSGPGAPTDKPPRRSPRSTGRPDEGERGAPRRSPQRRTRKPPEAPN